MNDKRIHGYDILRVISICLVCFIHSNVIYLASNRGTGGWLVATIITAFCDMAVPILFIVSGALLLNGESGRPFRFYRNRFLKQFLPFAVWSFIYVLAKSVYTHSPVSILSFAQLMNEPAYDQFWFMYTLLGVYLLLPILNAFLSAASKRIIEYLLILWLIFSVVQPTLVHYAPSFRLSEHVDMVLSEGYIGYFLLGYYLKKYTCPSKKKIGSILFGAGGIILIIHILMESSALSLSQQSYVYITYLIPSITLLSVGAFLSFADLRVHNHLLALFLQTLSQLSTGAYYIHMLVLRGVEYIGFSGKSNLFQCEAKALLVCVISFFLSFVLSKIPYLKTILTANGSLKGA